MLKDCKNIQEYCHQRKAIPLKSVKRAVICISNTSSSQNFTVSSSSEHPGPGRRSFPAWRLFSHQQQIIPLFLQLHGCICQLLSLSQGAGVLEQGVLIMLWNPLFYYDIIRVALWSQCQLLFFGLLRGCIYLIPFPRQYIVIQRLRTKMLSVYLDIGRS